MNGRVMGSSFPSTAVVEVVADVEDVDPCDLPESLADAIDPDALDELFRDRPSADGQVTFQFCEHQVTVTSDNRVTVDDPNESRSQDRT